MDFTLYALAPCYYGRSRNTLFNKQSALKITIVNEVKDRTLPTDFSSEAHKHFALMLICLIRFFVSRSQRIAFEKMNLTNPRFLKL